MKTSRRALTDSLPTRDSQTPSGGSLDRGVRRRPRRSAPTARGGGRERIPSAGTPHRSVARSWRGSYRPTSPPPGRRNLASRPQRASVTGCRFRITAVDDDVPTIDHAPRVGPDRGTAALRRHIGRCGSLLVNCTSRAAGGRCLPRSTGGSAGQGTMGKWSLVPTTEIGYARPGRDHREAVNGVSRGGEPVHPGPSTALADCNHRRPLVRRGFRHLAEQVNSRQFTFT